MSAWAKLKARGDAWAARCKRDAFTLEREREWWTRIRRGRGHKWSKLYRQPFTYICLRCREVITDQEVCFTKGRYKAESEYFKANHWPNPHTLLKPPCRTKSNAA